MKLCENTISKAPTASTPIERSTRQREAIRDVFCRAERPLSIDEIHGSTQALVPGLSLPTVYRGVRSLLEEGLICAVELPGRSAVYETAKRAHNHHHHFVCETCAKVYEIEGCTTIDAAIPEGFIAKGHDVVINGACKACA